MSILDDFELHARYDEMLNNVYGTVSVAGSTFDTARALKELDPIAYRVGFNDWTDSQIEDGALYELPNGDYTDEDPADEDADA